MSARVVRRRLDVELVRRGLCESRARAAAAIGAGHVLVGGAIAEKPARLVAPGEPIELRVPRRFVSRGGWKLEAALDEFGLDVHQRRCVDAGSSTGGFTDCLLQRGAAEVVAIDVGRGQLDGRLRSDPRVRVVEGVNVRELDPALVGESVDVVVADLSFISLRLVAASLRAVASDDADFVFLVKPQFEAGRRQVGRGGIVRDADVHRDVLHRVVGELASAGLAVQAIVPSPIRGGSGNVEFLVHLRRGDVPAVEPLDIDRSVEEAHGEGVPR